LPHGRALATNVTSALFPFALQFRANEVLDMDELEKMQEDVFGKVGDPVPAVDPDELLRFWRVSEDIRARHGNQQIAIGQSAYGPVTDFKAVSYRAMVLWAMRHLSQNADQVRKGLKDPNDFAEVDTLERCLNTPVPTEAALKAMAAVPLTWPALPSSGVPGFDVGEFGRLCESA